MYLCRRRTKRIAMFKRNILSQLLEWKESKFRKPLILRGARQVGKTTAVKQLAEHYANYIYMNMELEENRRIISSSTPLDDLIDLLYARMGEKKEGDTLIFFDEIQNSPQAIAMLRYFYEERPDIHVIAAGSLLENVVDVKASFPVGRVQYLAMRPCFFEEFLIATGQENLISILNNPEYTVPLHERLSAQFGKFALIGGMPEVVNRYSLTKDIYKLDEIYETLVQAYKDDVEKYVKSGKLTEVVRFILDKGWASAGEIITLGGFAGSDYKSREIGEAFRLLEKAMLLELVYPTTSVSLPAIGEVKRMPKLLWMDTGLVNYQAGVRMEYLGAKDILDLWRGRLAEQIVGQELLALNNKVSNRRQFWVRGKSQAEVDFLVNVDSTIFPVEVKNGHNSSLKSLHSFISQAPIDIAVRVWSGSYSVDDVKTADGKIFKLINLPFYLLHRLEEIINKV